MAKSYNCPFFKRERETGKGRSVVCEAVDITFKGKDARRAWVFPLCGSAEFGYMDCPFYKILQKNYEEKDHENRKP